MEIGECQEFDLELEDHDLIANDQFPETVDAKKVDNNLGIDVDGHLPELCESTEPERNQRNGRYNLRKSLAWNSAFFTSAGVLDAEELSSMITGSDKKKNHILPGIQEELSGSTESISTLQSDSLTLETLDDDLFLDIRASIQRSSKKASNLTYSSSKIAAMELVDADGPTISSPIQKKDVNQNKNPKPVVMKTSGLQTVQMSKSQLKQTGKPSGRPIKQDSVMSQTGSIHKTGETNYVIPRPLKTISSSLPSSTAANRDFVGTGRVKPECGSSKQGPISCKVTQLPKVSALDGSRKVLLKSAVSLKSSTLGSSTSSSVHSTRFSTSSDNSINTSFGNDTKPTLMTARRNLVKNSNISTGSSGSIPKALSRTVSKNKLPAPTLSSYLKSTKISASVSPASSISEWSSVSSTTSSVVNQISNNLRTSVDTSSCRSVDDNKINLDRRNNQAGQKAERQGKQGVILPSSTSKKFSTESGNLLAPAKPSGLRLPSPKIGFFDGSSLRTPNGHQRSQSSSHPRLSKNGTATSTPTQSSNGKLRGAKVPMARRTSSLANITSGSPKAASPSSQEKSHSLVKPPTSSMDVNDSSSLSLGIKGSGTGEACQKAVEVEAENGDKQVVDEGTCAVDKDNLGDLSFNENMSSVDVETAAGEGNYTSGSEYISQASTPTQSLKHKLKSAQVPTARMSSSLANIKSGSPNAASPASSQKKSHALVKASSVSMDVNDSSILSLGVKGSEPEETYQKAMEVLSGNGDKQVVDVVTGAIDIDNFGDLSLNESINSGDIETASGEGSYTSGSEYISPIVGGILINKDSVPTSEAIEKENDPANSVPNCQLLSDKSECAAACIPPVVLKNFSCSSKCSDKPIELVIQVAGTGVAGKDNSCDLSLNKNINFGDIDTAAGEGSYTSGSECISQIGDGDSIQINKNSVPISEAIDKENDPSYFQGQGLTGDERGINQKSHELNCQLLSDTAECALFSTAAACRPPLALKDSCSNECFDNPSKVIHIAVAGNKSSGLPSLEKKETI